ncbi:tigger transposable element-derived protein 4-like [Parasteatoda tepidariorum]|uniref:tigger transposable element-derived protein 4-like n=1 Tax=Parasteatoda tepidariorum TaxID=114398 RepID=UPI0039BCC0AE
MPGKRKLTSLSLKEKKDLIALFEKSNVSKTAFAKEHNIPRTTLSDILSSKQTIEEADCKDEIKEILVRWLKHARSQNVPISSVILKEKAMEITKDRNSLSFKTICGEAAAVDGDAIENWRNSVLKDILSRFDASNVFNLDETGLFYRLLPDKTLSFKGEKCITGKASKQRLTLLLGANMNGNEKLKPLVIGKSKRPRCFKNVKSLPVEYEANSNAWMTTMIWERHIRKLDSQFSRQKRKVSIIVDNCTAHSQPESLKAIEIVFLPPNVTALLQPLHQGIIRDFKRKHAGFVADAESEDILCEEVDPELLENLLQVVNEKGCSVNDVNAFVDIDNDITICSQATVKDLTSEFLDEKQHSSSKDSENSCGIPPSKTETLEALEKIRRYLTSIEGTTEEDFKALMILEKKFNSNQQFLHQSTMLSYFNDQK